MGGNDKGLIECAGRPLIEWTLQRVEPLVDSLLISANRNTEQYARYGYPVLADQRADYPGPLAGIERGLASCSTDCLWVVPCDAPAVNNALLQRLIQGANGGVRAVVPVDAVYTHPTFALLHADLLDSLQAFLASGQRKAQSWLAGLPAKAIDCSDHPDWFANINTPQELAIYAARLHQDRGQQAI